MSDRCAKCGEVREEHAYSGACYGKCGKFIEDNGMDYKYIRAGLSSYKKGKSGRIVRNLRVSFREELQAEVHRKWGDSPRLRWSLSGSKSAGDHKICVYPAPDGNKMYLQMPQKGTGFSYLTVTWAIGGAIMWLPRSIVSQKFMEVVSFEGDRLIMKFKEEPLNDFGSKRETAGVLWHPRRVKDFIPPGGTGGIDPNQPIPNMTPDETRFMHIDPATPSGEHTVFELPVLPADAEQHHVEFQMKRALEWLNLLLTCLDEGFDVQARLVQDAAGDPVKIKLVEIKERTL